MAKAPSNKQNPPRAGKPAQDGGRQAPGRSPSLAERFRRGLSPKQVKLCVAAIALLLVVILSILIFAVACTPASGDSSTTGLAASSPVASVSGDDSFDRDAFSRVVGEYAGVLLDQTEDAGAAYVEETLFLGDSNTARMVTSQSVPEVTMANTIGIESMGITSVLGLRCVRFSGLKDMTIPSAVAVMQPKRIVINFGTNNAGMNTEGFIKSYRSAIEGIQEAWPYADIFIASVFPISQGCTYGGIKMSHVEEFNIALLDLAKEMGLRFLNWSDALKDPATGYAKSGYMVGDGVHLSDAGIQAAFEYFRTHSYEGEDTRPTPLKPVPKRLPTPEGLFPKPSPSPTATASSSSLSSSSSSSSSSSESSSSSSVEPTTTSTPTSVPSVPDPTSQPEQPTSVPEQPASTPEQSQEPPPADSPAG